MGNEKSWGGKRAGAGRKKGSGVKFYSFKAPQEVVDVLESVEGTKADFIIRSILAYAIKRQSLGEQILGLILVLYFVILQGR